MIPPPPRSTLFPYTTLFRSEIFQNSVTKNSKSGDSKMLAKAYYDLGTALVMTQKYSEAGPYFKQSNRSEEHTSELQSHVNLVCRLLLEKKKEKKRIY